MKKNYINLAALLLLMLSFSCKKSELPKLEKMLTGNEASIKFFNFSLSSPTVNFYGNDVKISGTVSATGLESATGTAYAGVFPGVNYSVLDPGQYTFKAQIPATATNPNTVVASLATTLDAGKKYSFYTCGVYNATARTSDAFILEDVPAPVDGNAYVRFVNTVPNAAAGFSLYAKNTVTLTETLVATSIAYKTTSTFTALPPGIYELYARYASAPTVNVISRNGTSVIAIIDGRSYTITARGSALTTPAVALGLDFTAIR